ncbi:YlaH-like family protein [Salinicoccus jeotgali]|uniref:YlaH-like family protein n=2 Tax=Salinicoccus jeotgali TaxID=381634 RepID=A0ABP7EIQ4_9STAP
MYLPDLMSVNVTERLTFFGRLFRLDSNPESGMWYLFITIFILSILVYNLGFARKVKVWQNAIIYVVMFLGCIILTFFGAFLPVAESLIVATAVLALYRFRLHQERKAGNIKTSGK